MSDQATQSRDTSHFRRLMVLTTVLLVALPLGWLGRELFRVRQMRIIAARLEALGCGAYSDNRLNRSQWLITQIVTWCGGDAPLYLNEIYANNSKFSDAEFVWLQGLEDLRSLDLGATSVTDEGLASLPPFANLQELTLDQTRVSDVGLAYIAKVPTLTTLSLNNTEVTDVGLASLQETKSLSHLSLWGNAVTARGVKLLREALPALEITCHWLPPVPSGQAASAADAP